MPQGKTCEELVEQRLSREIEVIRAMLKGGEEAEEKYSTLEEYGLSLDYVEPNTFDNQKEGYVRWQLSWGGPSDEFRFYLFPERMEPRCIEYWYMDWFDGASRQLRNSDKDLLVEIFDFLGMSHIAENGIQEYREECHV